MTLPKTTKSARANRPGCLFKDTVMNDLSLDLTAPQTLALSPEQRACLLGHDPARADAGSHRLRLALTAAQVPADIQAALQG